VCTIFNQDQIIKKLSKSVRTFRFLTIIRTRIIFPFSFSPCIMDEEAHNYRGAAVDSQEESEPLSYRSYGRAPQ